MKRLLVTAGVGAEVRRGATAAAQKASVSLDTAIRQMLGRGLTTEQIGDALERAFDAGQGPFAELNGMLNKAAVSSASSYVSIQSAREQAEGDPDAMGVWMTTGQDNVCDGCRALHGEQMTEGEFEELHGTNDCGGNCCCWWVKADEAPAGEMFMADIEREHPEYFHQMVPDRAT